MRKRKVYNRITEIICVLAALIAIFPLLWMMISGFKPASEVLSLPFHFFPRKIEWQNYVGLLNGDLDEAIFPQGASFLRSIGLTFLVSVVSVVGSLTINSMASYAFARLEFPLKKVLWVICLIPWFVPGISTYITSFTWVSTLGMLDTIAVLILPGLAHSYSMFYYRQFYLSFPREIEEAAKVDGAGFFQIFLRMFVPMSKTPFTIMGINVFLGYWSSFLWPVLTISSPEKFQINQLISYFKSSYNQNMQYVLAAASIAAIPVIVLFLIFQRQIMEGIKISGMKS